MSYGFLPGIVIPVCVMTVVGAADGFGFLAGQVMVSRAVEEERQAGALGLMGAVEVLGAGVAAIPAALLYDHAGVEVVWLTMGTTTLAILGLARLRLRGTSPVSTAVFADTAVAIEPHAPLPR
jgi:predicted MFS family arabinose efflux permease